MNRSIGSRHVWFYIIYIPLIVYFGYMVSGGDVRHTNVSFYIIVPVIFSYWILMVLCYKTRFTIHSFLHLFAFEAAVITGLSLDNHLDEMAGMINIFAPLGVLAVVLVGMLLMCMRRQKNN